MNARIVNLAAELKPTGGAEMQEVAVGTGIATIGTLKAQTTHVFVSLDGADVRLTVDGTDPVANSHGHLVPDRMSDWWSAAFARTVKVTRNAGTSATLRVSEMTR